MPDRFTPADLGVPADGIASRVLLKTGGGSATAFAFGAGAGLDEHTSPREALLVVTEGEARVTLDGATHTLGPGAAIRLPADVPHAVHAAVDLRMLLILLRP